MTDSNGIDANAIIDGIYGDGIVGLKGGFAPEWADALRADIMALFEEARQVPGGTMPRGPQRWYVEVQPERVRGFVDIATHPWFVAVCEAVLGVDYQIVEVGFDIPLPGAADQPWHRDFPASAAALAARSLDSVAFNLTAVDTRPEHGPFEIAPGTQWDEIRGCKADMFPPKELWPRYAGRAMQKLPQRGDISARSGLAIHRGTANRSDEPRPVLIVGVVAGGATSAEHHMVQATREYLDALSPRVRDHLFCQPVERVGPIRQRHMIQGLLEPGYG